MKLGWSEAESEKWKFEVNTEGFTAEENALLRQQIEAAFFLMKQIFRPLDRCMQVFEKEMR